MQPTETISITRIDSTHKNSGCHSNGWNRDCRKECCIATGKRDTRLAPSRFPNFFFSLFFPNELNNLFALLKLDECDQLALTIGRIMEEAGDKMEGNIDEIKITYSQRMQKLEEIIKKVHLFERYAMFSLHWKQSYVFFQLIVSKETLTKNNQLSRKHVHELQSNLSKLLETNDALNADLQTASKTIVRKLIETDEYYFRHWIRSLLGWIGDEAKGLWEADCMRTSHCQVISSSPFHTNTQCLRIRFLIWFPQRVWGALNTVAWTVRQQYQTETEVST